MKTKYLILIILFLPILCFSQKVAREKFEPIDLLDNAGNTVWSISKTADDTSAVYNAFSEQSIGYNMWDPSASDSIGYSIKVFMSHSFVTTPDSTFSLEQTINVASSGIDYTQLNIPTGMKWFFVVTGTSEMSAFARGEFTACGWTNADNANIEGYLK